MTTSYYYLASKSKIVRISLSEHDSSCWGIYLNDRLLYDRCRSAEEAADCAHNNDFGDELAVQLFTGVAVPSDINQWRTTPPELPFQHELKPKDCAVRHRRTRSTQLGI